MTVTVKLSHAIVFPLFFSIIWVSDQVCTHGTVKREKKLCNLRQYLIVNLMKILKTKHNKLSQLNIGLYTYMTLPLRLSYVKISKMKSIKVNAWMNWFLNIYYYSSSALQISLFFSQCELKKNVVIIEWEIQYIALLHSINLSHFLLLNT